MIRQFRFGETPIGSCEGPTFVEGMVEPTDLASIPTFEGLHMLGGAGLIAAKIGGYNATHRAWWVESQYDEPSGSYRDAYIRCGKVFFVDSAAPHILDDQERQIHEGNIAGELSGRMGIK